MIRIPLLLAVTCVTLALPSAASAYVRSEFYGISQTATLDDQDMQGMRAARLVVDTGLHALDWTRDRAIATLEEAGVSRSDAEVETDRYVTMPGQALSYKIGQFEIERQRAAAAGRPGFSLPGFHDRLLSLGSLPLAALRRELER